MNLLAFDEAVIDRELGSKSLLEYIHMAWEIVEPARPFLTNWHIEAICDHLEAVTKGDITRLVINTPPGSMKSLTCSVFWPSWVWTHTPQHKWITASYSGAIARRDAIRSRRIMETRWYQERWGHLWRQNPDDWSSLRYSNTRAGFRFTTTPGGAATGEHADTQLVDDPIKPADASSGAVDTASLRANIEWWDETMSSRMVDPAKSRRVITMQRLHHKDLTGHVFVKDSEYEHLCLPMKYEPKCVIAFDHRCSLPLNAKNEPTSTTTIGFEDPRTEEGELLWPDRFSQETVDRRHKEMGARGAATQDQQRPVPLKGGLIEHGQLQHYRELPEGTTDWLQSWDMSFKETQAGSYVVGQVWCKKGPNYYLVAQVRRRMEFTAAAKAVVQLSEDYPQATAKLVESAANGPAIMSQLKDTTDGILGISAKGSKLARFSAVTPLIEAGNVYIPDPKLGTWVEEYIEELVSFPDSLNDDQVDATSQALARLKSRKTEIDDVSAMDMPLISNDLLMM